MGSRCGLKIVRNYPTSLARRREVFCDSLAGSLKVLDIIIPPIAYPKGAILFMEGQAACGIFAVCDGRVKLSTSSRAGRQIILKIAEAGEVLGLPATLSGRPYEVTAEVSEGAQVNFIPRAAFLRFLQTNPEALMQVAQLLTNDHYAGHEMIQSLGLLHSASEKLARFLLGWSTNHAHGQDRLHIALTQEEIGETIGVSRETITRLLTTFKKRNLLTVNGVWVNLCNRAALQVLAGT
jgi:CRP/FNR family transcriptional regulator, cyclic AMP receptor protein